MSTSRTEASSVRFDTGRRMYVDPADARGSELLRSHGAFNEGTRRMWRATLALEEWDVVVDVGANYGEMVLAVELPAGARVTCFEPNPRVLPHLRRSLEESGLDVDLREVAIGAGAGVAAFTVDTEWSGRSGLAHTHRTDEEHRLESMEVPVRTLDSQLDLSGSERVCVKVDVEGGEFDVLEGARTLLTSERPWAVMLEVLHMDSFEHARLAREFTMRVMDRRTGRLVTVPPASPQLVTQLLEAGWLHAQDAVLTAKETR